MGAGRDCVRIVAFVAIFFPTMRSPHLLLAAIATYPHFTEAYMQERLKSAPGPSDSCSSATSDVSTSTTTTNVTNANAQSECNVSVDVSQRHGDIGVSSMR